MISNDSTLMKMLGMQMRYMAQRQGVLAQNIANADTPNYEAMDLKKPDFAQMMAGEMKGGLTMAATSPKHIQGTLGGPGMFAAREERDTSEITPTGNTVVLEEQMAKVSDTGAQFQLSASLIKKFTGMYRAALGNR